MHSEVEALTVSQKTSARTKTQVPLVAIVTPVYNGARFLAEAIASVAAQDYPNLIHIILDNASTDGTDEIIRAHMCGRVPIVTRRNDSVLPLADNWNAAIAMIPVEAVYFQLLPADDAFNVPYAVSKRVAIAESDPSIGVVTSLWRAEGTLCGVEIPPDREVFDSGELMRSFFRREHSGLGGPFALIRTTKIDRALPFYDPDFIAGGDVEATLRCMLHGKTGYVHEELSKWRSHDQQTSVTYVTRNKLVHWEWFLLLDRYGSYVMGRREYKACRQAFRRHYLRRLLVTLVKDKDKAVFDWHMRALKARDDAAGMFDFIDALVDWVRLKFTGHGADIGVTSRPAFGAPAYIEKLPRHRA